MENINKYICDIKETLLNSPIRERLAQEEIVPFKNIVFENLNKQIENIKGLESTTYKALNIAIVGEVKSGKSSFLNALLGKKVSKVDVLEATSSVIEVVYGEKGIERIDCFSRKSLIGDLNYSQEKEHGF